MHFHHCNVFSPLRKWKFKGSIKRGREKKRRWLNKLDGKNEEERREMMRAAHKAHVHSAMKAGPSSVAFAQI